jgi:hypothetical protein
MVLYPEVAIKLQAELDSVLGSGERLPSIEDREDMPYLENTMLELLRWQPITPLGGSCTFLGCRVIDFLGAAVPHATMEDDIYRSYHIPKGAIV